MRASIKWRALLATSVLLAIGPIVGSAQVASLQVQSARRQLVMPSKNMVPVRDAMLILFRNRVQLDKQNPGLLSIRSANDTARVEFRPTESLMLVDGAERLTKEIVAVGTALAQQVQIQQATVGQPAGSFPAEGMVRIMPLSRFGQQALARLTPSEPPQIQRVAAQDDPSSPAPTIRLGAGQLPEPTPPENGEQAATLPLQPFEGVQIETLPEIDAIILRGRDKQLEDLAEIIKRLDDASRTAQPEIEVIQLEHVQAAALAELIQSTSSTLVGARQGRATVTPLGKPNAILLIGWGEAFTSIKKLIANLDRPVAPNSQFAVFQLTHADATEVQSQLQQFFQGRDGLGPVIESTVDSRTNAIIVHAAPRDLSEVRSLIERLDVARGTATQQARVYPIRNSIAADVAATLQQALNPTGQTPIAGIELLDPQGMPLATGGILGTTQVTVNERNNTLIITSSAENHALIEMMIKQIDTPGMVAKIKIFPVLNGDAGALTEMLRSLIPAPAATTTGNAPRLSSAPEETSLIPMRFTVDSRGNNIIAVGSEGDLKIVEALIIRLDESDTMQRKSTVYQLKNSPAVDVALAINEFLRNKRQVENVTPGASNPFEQLEKEVVVVPEPVQNKLILSATPRYYEEISKLIEQLDQQPPQVMIQVMIAEIMLGDTDEFGMELGLQSSVLFDRGLLGDLLTRTTTTTTSTPAGVVTSTVEEIVAATNAPGFNFNSTQALGNSGSSRALAGSNNVGGQGISNFAVGRGNDELGFGGLVLSASSENVSFLMRALQENRRLEILSRPQILTLDNQQAFIQVGQRVPRIVNSIINQNGAQNNVELENVGLIIGVTPRISPEGNVVMEIDAEKSSLGPEMEGIPVSIAADGTVIRSPRVDTITAQATVSAADGETIILGGLISRNTRTVHRKVPWLGDIPVIKYLFRYDLFDMRRTELLIIMTPHVVRSQEDMERLKQAEFARMSWCAGDVFQMHGDVYPTADLSREAMERDDWNVVYPDEIPRGIDNLPPPVIAAPQPSLGEPQ